MGLFARMLKQFDPKYDSIESHVISILNRLYDLTEKVSRVGFWDGNGKKLLDKVKDISLDLKGLKAKVEILNTNIDGYTIELKEFMDNEDHEAIKESNKRASQINAIIGEMTQKLKRIKHDLTNGNLMAGLNNLLDDTLDLVKNIYVKSIQPAIKGLIQGTSDVYKRLTGSK